MSRPDSPEDLLQQLEQLTGRSFKNRDDVRAFVEVATNERNAASERSLSRWRGAKQTVLLALVALAAVQYFSLDVLVQIASLRSITVFVPVSDKVRTGSAPSHT